MKIKKILGDMVWYPRTFLTYFGLKRKYRINNYSIQIDFDHRLPYYQNSHPFYDKFLPHLVQYLPKNSLVIDVGANVGDTLVGMLAHNDQLHYLCIEASDHFFSDLKKNINSLRTQNSELNISIVNEFVGKNITNISLDGKDGTKHAAAVGDIKAKTMISILSELGLESLSLSLLKTDVDGFDWDVISASYEVLSHKPYVYFECEYFNLEQLASYEKLFSEMISKGYSKFAFFDNFGQFILSTEKLTEIKDLLYYVKRQNFFKSSRTYYYYDVLAFSSDKYEKVEALIADYNESHDKILP